MSLYSRSIRNLLGSHPIRPDLVILEVIWTENILFNFTLVMSCGYTGLILSQWHGYLMEIIHSGDTAINLWP